MRRRLRAPSTPAWFCASSLRCVSLRCFLALLPCVAFLRCVSTPVTPAAKEGQDRFPGVIP